MDTKEKALITYLDRIAVSQMQFVSAVGEPLMADMKNGTLPDSPQIQSLLESIVNVMGDLYAEINKQNSANTVLNPADMLVIDE